MNKKIVSYIIGAIILIIIGLSYMFWPHSEPQVPTSTPATEENNLKPQADVTEVAQASTTSPVVQKRELATTTTKAQSAPLPPLKMTTYVDKRWKFSIQIPEGFIVDPIADSATSSLYVLVIKRSDDKSKTPDPTLTIRRTDLTQKYFTDYDSLKSSIDMIKEEGPDIFVNWMIDMNLKKEYNQFTITSTKKKKINDVVFYEIAGTYRGDTTGKLVDIGLYITLSEKRVYILSVEAYADNPSSVRLANQLLRGITTFSITN